MLAVDDVMDETVKMPSRAHSVYSGPPDAKVVLIAAEDSADRAELAQRLSSQFKVIAVASASEGELVLASGPIAVVMTTASLTDMPGLNWLSQVRRLHPSVMRMFAAIESSETLAIASVNLAGVFRYVHDPLSGDRLAAATQEAITVAAHRVGPMCMREAVQKTIKAHTLCENSSDGCLVEAQRLREPLPEKVLSKLSERLGWAGVLLVAALIFFATAFAVGFGIIVVLYLFKSLLGIDLVPDRHWTNWFQ